MLKLKRRKRKKRQKKKNLTTKASNASAQRKTHTGSQSPTFPAWVTTTPHPTPMSPSMRKPSNARQPTSLRTSPSTPAPTTTSKTASQPHLSSTTPTPSQFLKNTLPQKRSIQTLWAMNVKKRSILKSKIFFPSSNPKTSMTNNVRHILWLILLFRW